MKPRIVEAPFAVCSDGLVLVNISCHFDETEPAQLLELAMQVGTPVFIGSRLRPSEVHDVLRHLDDAAFEAVAGLSHRVRSRRKKAAR